MLCNSKSYVAGSVFTQNSPHIVYDRAESGVEYRFTMSWTPDASDTCRQMTQGQLLPSVDQCKSTLIRDYTDCDNGGWGGWIESGCLRFDFSPSDF
ncbi:hypothetical protein FJTKL_08107 [Diaporthe vaccinii]